MQNGQLLSIELGVTMETQIIGDNSMSPELQSILSTIPEEAKQEFVTEIKRDILRELAYDDFPSFCEYCFKDTEKREGNFIVLKDFHKEWCELLKTENRLNLFCPVSTGKTSLITVAYPIWRLGRDANTRIVLISATYSQATKYLSEIKDNILDNRYVKEVFPNLKPLPDKIYKNRPSKWAEDAITVTRSLSMKDFSIQALGVLGPLLNARTDLMIFDDVVTLQNSASVRSRQKMIEWFDSTALTRLTKTAQCVFVGTAWFNCYSDPEQPIITTTGIKSISEMAIGDAVFDEVWNATKVTRVFKDTYNGPIYIIGSRYSNPVKCTPNHKFMTEYGWVEAKNLSTTHNLKSSENILQVTNIDVEPYDGYIYDIQTEAGGYHIPYYYVHNSDLPHYLEDKAGWTTVKYSVLKKDKELGYGLASWPERYSEERLAGMRAHNEREFNRTMRNVAKTADAYPFAAYIEGMLGDFKRDDTWKHIIGMDLSTKKREGTTIIVVAHSQATGRKVIVDIEYGAWKSSVKKAKLIQCYNKYLPDKIVVEANSLQDDLVDDYKELRGSDRKRLPVKGVITTSSMKDVALVNLEEEFEEGMWKIAYRNNPHFERLKKELELYPDYKTTDGVMALLFCTVMIGGKRSKSGQIRVSVINPDGKIAHSTKKHKYDFIDYRLFNRMMQKAGTDVKMPKNYPEIVDWIKKYQKYDEVDMTRKPELVEDKDYRIVLNEMISFVKALREI